MAMNRLARRLWISFGSKSHQMRIRSSGNRTPSLRIRLSYTLEHPRHSKNDSFRYCLSVDPATSISHRSPLSCHCQALQCPTFLNTDWTRIVLHRATLHLCNDHHLGHVEYLSAIRPRNSAMIVPNQTVFLRRPPTTDHRHLRVRQRHPVIQSMVILLLDM